MLSIIITHSQVALHSTPVLMKNEPADNTTNFMLTVTSRYTKD